MKKAHLVAPCNAYKESFINYALAYQKIGDAHYYEKYKPALEDFEVYLNKLELEACDQRTLEGEVATSHFWLVDGMEVVGVVRVRHEDWQMAGHIGYDISPVYRQQGYGKLILKLALEKARALGIEEAVVTCHIENRASRRIIESCNGKWTGEIYDEEEDEHLNRFVISIK